MQRILITGAETLVGANLAVALADRFEVVAVSVSGAELPGCLALAAGGTRGMRLSEAVATSRPAWILHCGPAARSSWDEPTAVEPAVAARQGLELSEAARGCGAELTVLSTDAVFAGPGMFHDESSLRTGDGHQAAVGRAVEDILRNTDTLVVRSCIVGWHPTEAAETYVDRLWNALHEETPCVADADRHATPILATQLAELLLPLREAGCRGIVNLGGAERCSQAGFAMEFAGRAGVRLCNSNVAVHGGTRPRRPAPETSLSSELACRTLGRGLPLVREAIELLLQQQADGFLERLRTGRNVLAAAA